MTCSRFAFRIRAWTPFHFLTLSIFSIRSPNRISQYHIQVMSSRKRSSDSGVGLDNSVRPKKAKVNTTAETKIDSNGDRYWEISKMRRLTISSFRGKTQVNVREYYEKDGQELPGKKVD